MQNMNPSRRSFLAAGLAAGVASRLPAQATLHHDTIRLDREFQEIENFGASDCWSMQKIGGWSDESRNRIADLLFSPTKGIALSCWRFNIGAGVNPRITNPWRTAETFEVAEGQYDWTRQQNERWFLGAAKARGVPQFLAFANSPPGRMTRNGLTFCNADASPTNLKAGFERQYARYLCDILEHFHKNPDAAQRIAFNYISPVNEPQWDWSGHSQEGNRADNASIQAMARSLAADLKGRGLPTQIALVESGSLPDVWQPDAKATQKYGVPYGDYLNALAGDPSFSSLLSGRIGYHSYWSDRISDQLVNHRTSLGAAMRAHPGWKLWQTEYCVMDGPNGEGGNGRDLTMTTALNVARVIHLDLTLAGASAWQWWLAVSPSDYKDGLIYTDWKQPGDPETIYLARLLWAMGNYSRFVRPGARRIELEGDAHDVQGLMGAAFKDGKMGNVAAVYINMSTQDRQMLLQFVLDGRPWHPEKLVPYVTSDREGDELKAYPAAPPGEPVTIPARSVVTLTASLAVHKVGKR
jgi:hypothetical protein